MGIKRVTITVEYDDEEEFPSASRIEYDGELPAELLMSLTERFEELTDLAFARKKRAEDEAFREEQREPGSAWRKMHGLEDG